MRAIYLLLLCTFIFAGDTPDHTANTHITYSIIHIIPFIGILLSIALIPLFFHHFWEKNYGKVVLFWAFSFLIPVAIQITMSHGFYISLIHISDSLLHTIFTEYIPFIILLLSLFTVSGGICLKGKLVGTPILNLIILIIGTILASWMGTTGAAMLLIRPIIKANKWRQNKVHIMVFFIFLVANIGGTLTPLGDPPLFLGFLQGVKFNWTITNLFSAYLYVSIILLVLFFLIDSYYYRKERKKPDDDNKNLKIEILGKINFVLLLGIILAVLLSGFQNIRLLLDYTVIGFSHTFKLYHANILRDIILVVITILSVKLTSEKIRGLNGFTWFPIIEVGKLFFGIFITIIPAISMLKAGNDGDFAFIISMLTKDGSPSNMMYFWLTGLLSAFLDNAPTYLIFFNTAAADITPEFIETLKNQNPPIEKAYYNAHWLMSATRNSTLIAISCGAVFMGALTYIGNAPNFMVRAIAEENGIKMPSFFGYMVWSFVILGLTLLSYSIIFI